MLHYKKAVEIDPDFARAWEGLAAVYSVVESWGFQGRDWDSLAIQAAERVRAVMVGPVAAKLDVPTERLVFAGGMVFDAQDPEQNVSFAEAVALTETATGTVGSVGSYRPPKSPGRYRGAGVGPSPAELASSGSVVLEENT